MDCEIIAAAGQVAKISDQLDTKLFGHMRREKRVKGQDLKP